MIIRCPMCHLDLVESNNSVAHSASSLVCVKCDKSYASLDGYYDLYISNEDSADASYTPKTKHLLYSRDKILSMQHLPRVFPVSISKHWRNPWNMKLDKLKGTVKQAGTSERARVEFMVDDYTNEEFKNQERFTECKAKIISEFIAKVDPVERNVLHMGCGGYCNRAIPMMYSREGYKNWGIDVVRSYVKEFLEYGEAHLANVTALPFADGTFDVINFTDILEHLFDPLKGLQEACRVLKHNGHIILDTPNRGCITAWNPFSALRFLASIIIPGIRKPRIITEEWDGEVYFHTQFSRDEIEGLLSQAGFNIKYIKPKHLTYADQEKEISAILLKEFLAGKMNNDPWFVLAQKDS